jgi:tetratricopeptide (TPR) repeat protein
MDQSQPLDPQALITQADVLIERRRYAQARGLLAQGLRSYPADERLCYRLAYVDYREERYAEALQTLQDLLRNVPDHYGARSLQAHVLEETQQLAAAERVWIDLLREYPEDADSYASYGLLMLRTLHIDKGSRLADEALRFEPEHATALFVKGMAELIQGKAGTMNEHLAKLIREHPEQRAAASALIVALQDRGDAQGALRISRELLAAQPDDEAVVEMTRELHRNAHWSMLPLYPMQRWGWGGAAAVWVAGVIGLRMLDGRVSPTTQLTITVLWLLYVLYSWIWPPILKRLL